MDKLTPLVSELLLCTLFILFSYTYGKGLECVNPSGNCACETNKGLLDLSALDSKDPKTPKFLDIPGSGGSQDSFSYNPCSGFSESYACSNVALCQKRNSGYTMYWPIGDQKQPLWVNDKDTGELQMQYSSNYYGSVRTSLITLICEASIEGELIPHGEQQPGSALFTFDLKTRYACLGGGTGALSPGSILLIVFFCLVFVYLMVGVVYNTVSKGAKGKERIPNADFWTSVPHLIKDGGVFCAHTLTGKGSAQTYESM